MLHENTEHPPGLERLSHADQNEAQIEPTLSAVFATRWSTPFLLIDPRLLIYLNFWLFKFLVILPPDSRSGGGGASSPKKRSISPNSIPL